MRGKDKIKRSAQGYIIRWLKLALKKQEENSKDLKSDKKMFWFCLEDELNNYDLNNKDLVKKISGLIFILDNNTGLSLDFIKKNLHELDNDLKKIPVNPKEFIRSLKKNIKEEVEEKEMWKSFESDQKEKQQKQDLQNGQATRELFNLK